MMRLPLGRDRRRTAGLTMAELLITAAVMSSALVAVSWSMSATARTHAAFGASDGPAFFMAKEIHALAEALPREPSGATGALVAADVLALDSLVGASFSPPILADGSVIDGFDGWSQTVSLSVFAVDDLSQATADDPAAGLPPDAAKLYRLQVDIADAGDEIDSFHWWITP